MPEEKRRVLTADEKQGLLDTRKVCYICLGSLENYGMDELQFDHIYNYVDGNPQDLANFAPVHASSHPNKLNCHRDKGRKSPVDYREELRIGRELQGVTGLKDICKDAIPSIYSLADDRRSIEFNGVTLPVYNQRIGGKDHLYFFHEVETKFIENDEEIQLRPLEPKIVPLITNLKSAVQLMPSLGRLDPGTKTVKIFDGQHKAVAQIIGNKRKSIACIVFVHADVHELRQVIFDAHTTFVQQSYKKSHVDAKLADIYRQKIEAYRKQVGDPNAPFTEANILRGETKAKIRQDLLSYVIAEMREKRQFIQNYAAEDRAEQKQKPVLWQSMEKIVANLCNLTPVDQNSEHPLNFRAAEIENLGFILDQMEASSLKGKWDAGTPESKHHQLARTYYYRTAFNNWIVILAEAYKFALEQMQGVKLYDAICYREEFSPEVKGRFIKLTRKLFDHPLWVQETIQNEIATTNQDAVVAEIFKREGMDYIYLTHL